MTRGITGVTLKDESERLLVAAPSAAQVLGGE
jgi:hypothetical protein